MRFLAWLACASLLAGCAHRPPRHATPRLFPAPDVARLWAAFGPDWKSNCLAWTHDPANPALPPSGRTWQSRWTANPDVLSFHGRTLLFYRGRGIQPGTDDREHDRIGLSDVTLVSRTAMELRPRNAGQPIVDVGPPGSYDDRDVLDPATVVFHDRIWLYYSAIGAGPDSVGLAVSDDGEHFTKVGKIMDGRAPDVVVHGGRIVMLYQKLVGESYRLHAATSEDGRVFRDLGDEPVFRGQEGSWDAQSITTARFLEQDGWFYLLYGGSAYLADEPDLFGLARSRDLVHWERHPGNPVFGCGAQGSPDGAALWFPALLETRDDFVLLYEGSPGKYRWGLNSTICRSWLPKKPAIRR